MITLGFKGSSVSISKRSRKLRLHKQHKYCINSLQSRFSHFCLYEHLQLRDQQSQSHAIWGQYMLLQHAAQASCRNQPRPLAPTKIEKNCKWNFKAEIYIFARRLNNNWKVILYNILYINLESSYILNNLIYNFREGSSFVSFML